jgi:hypothetical protein
MPKINSRAKGTKGERELKEFFFQELGVYLVRNPDQTRKGGYDCSLRTEDDLDAPIAIPFALEFKRNETLPPWKMWEQAVSQVTKSCYVPIVAYRRNRQKWRFIIPWCLLYDEIGPYTPGYEDSVDIGIDRFIPIAKKWLSLPLAS